MCSQSGNDSKWFSKKWQVAPGQTWPLMWIITTKSDLIILGCELLGHQVEKRSASWYSFKYRLVFGGTGSVEGGTGRHLVVLGQNRAVLVASVICFRKIYGLHGLYHQIVEYCVSRGRYWLVLGGTGSEQGGTGCQYDELSENIWFAWSKSSNYWIFEGGKSDYGQTDKQTDKQTDRQNFLL